MPDRASVRVGIEGEGASRDDAFGEAALLATAVDEVVAAFASVLAGAATAALVVQPKTRWKRGEDVRTGWRAARTSTLEVVDFTRLGDLIAQLAVAGAMISGPYWQLERSNAVHAEARRLAAVDARQRAEDYAAALGLELDAVLWVAEPGLRGGTDGGGGFAYSISAQGVAGSGSEDVIEVTPEEMSVHATVEVAFSLR